jgi:hypothetical protein
MTMRPSRSAALGALLALLVAAAPAPAREGGDGDRREARVAGHCSRGASSELRLRSRDGAIRVEFTVKRHRSGERWRTVLVHERRVAARATSLTSGSSGSFRVRRSLDDYDGPDRVTARGSGPGGLSCEASATLAA